MGTIIGLGVLIIAIVLIVAFPEEPFWFSLGLDLITISLFFSITFSIIAGGAEKETSEYGAYFIVLIPLAIVLVVAFTHLVSVITPALNAFFTAGTTPEQTQTAVFVGLFVVGLIFFSLGILGFILNLTRIGDRSAAGQIIREAERLKLSKEWNPQGKTVLSGTAIENHIFSKFGDKMNDEAKGKLKDYFSGGATAGTGQQNFYAAMGAKKTSSGRVAVNIVLIILGFVLMFVSLAPLGVKLPAMNIVAVYYLTLILTLVVALTTLPHTDPMIFFEDSGARNVMLQIFHTLGYDKRYNFMSMVQQMGGEMKDEELDNQVARIEKELSGRTLDLVENKQIGREMYPLLMKGYENMLKAPFYQILQVRDVVIWSILVFFMAMIIAIITNVLPSGFNFFGYELLGADLLNANQLACFSMHSNIISLLLWAAFVVSTVVFIVRRSTFTLTLLLPESVYLLINTVFGRKQFFSVIMRLALTLLIATIAIREMDLYKAQDWFFYLQPFFAISILGAIMFISTIFYIAEVFTLSTLGGFIHKGMSIVAGGAKEVVGAAQTGRMGILLGAVFFLIALFILIPYWFFGVAESLGGWWLGCSIIAGVVMLMMIMPLNKNFSEKGNRLDIKTLFFILPTVICFLNLADPQVVGYTLLPIAFGLIIFGGNLE